MRNPKSDAYDYLEAQNLQWGRKDADWIYVWESGYQVRSDTQEVLAKSGFIAMRQEFDKVCGKTVTWYKDRPLKKGK